MKKCLHCGEEIQDIAKKCKYCGEWIKEDSASKQEKTSEKTEWQNNPKLKEKNNSKIAGVIIWIVVFVLIFFYVKSQLQTQTQDETQLNFVSEFTLPQVQLQGVSAEPTIQVSAHMLYKDYDANEVRADDKYKGKTLEISWKISSIWKDIMGNPTIQLDWAFRLNLSLSTSETSSALNLNKWDSITLQCQWEGMVIGFINLGECIIK